MIMLIYEDIYKYIYRRKKRRCLTLHMESWHTTWSFYLQFQEFSSSLFAYIQPIWIKFKYPFSHTRKYTYTHSAYKSIYSIKQINKFPHTISRSIGDLNLLSGSGTLRYSTLQSLVYVTNDKSSELQLYSTSFWIALILNAHSLCSHSLYNQIPSIIIIIQHAVATWKCQSFHSK